MRKTKDRDERIDELVDCLGCSIAEAEKILADDEIINKGGRCEWEPSIEEEKAMRKLTKLSVPRTRTETKRVRKLNDAKRELISLLMEALKGDEGVLDLVVENEERKIAFGYGENKFEVVLTQKRAKKD